jgi:hypothetical protein
MKYIVLAMILMSTWAHADTEVVVKRGGIYHVVTTDCQVANVKKARVARIKERAPIELITDKHRVTCTITKVEKLEVA